MNHQVLFTDIFTLQRRMRKRTLGIAQWHAVGQRRVQLMPGKFIQVSELMLLVRMIFLKVCIHIYAHILYILVHILLLLI